MREEVYNPMDDFSYVDTLLATMRTAKTLGHPTVVILATGAFPAVLEREVNDKLDQLEAQLLTRQ